MTTQPRKKDPEANRRDTANFEQRHRDAGRTKRGYHATPEGHRALKALEHAQINGYQFDVVTQPNKELAEKVMKLERYCTQYQSRAINVGEALKDTGARLLTDVFESAAELLNEIE